MFLWITKRDIRSHINTVNGIGIGMCYYLCPKSKAAEPKSFALQNYTQKAKWEIMVTKQWKNIVAGVLRSTQSYTIPSWWSDADSYSVHAQHATRSSCSTGCYSLALPLLTLIGCDVIGDGDWQALCTLWLDWCSAKRWENVTMLKSYLFPSQFSSGLWVMTATLLCCQ